MRKLAFAACLLGLSVSSRWLDARQARDAPPAWAYGVPAAPTSGGVGPRNPAPGQADDGSPKTLPGSAKSFTLAQLRDGFNVADWFPDDHPAPPPIVMTGRRPDVRACGLCHYPNGKGRPENAPISGLPPIYFAMQMADFKNDLRKSAEPRKTNTAIMIAIAKGMTDDEVAATAQYFGSIPWTPWIRVVETADVPKTRVSGGMFIPLDGSETEPLGARIIEVPEHPDRTELRDPRSGFVAYVPSGTVARGETLVATGAGKTTPCGICHGSDLKGLGPVPGIVGRSPSYQARQLYDMQAGTRKGIWADLMRPVVQKLTADDLIAISAYLASR